MIIVIAKKYKNGKWVDFDANEMYKIGSVITLTDGKEFEVTQINGSKVTLVEKNKEE